MDTDEYGFMDELDDIYGWSRRHLRLVYFDRWAQKLELALDLGPRERRGGIRDLLVVGQKESAMAESSTVSFRTRGWHLRVDVALRLM